MKFVHTADWHIGKNVCDFSMLPDQRDFLAKLSSFLEREKVDALIIAGDLYDRPIPSAEAVSLLDSFFSDVVLRLKIPVLVIAGNHDSGDRLSFGGALLSKAGLHICGDVGCDPSPVALFDEHGEIDCWLLPFADISTVNNRFSLEGEDKARSAQQAFDKAAAPILSKADPLKRNLLVCHGFFCCTEEPTTVVADEAQGGIDLVNLNAFRHFDYVAAGHVHRPQNISSGMRYSGSIMKYSAKETTNCPALTIVEIEEKGNCDVQTIVLPPLRDMRIVEGSFDVLNQSENRSDDYVFVVLSDSELVLNAASRLRETFPNLMGVSYFERERTTGVSPTKSTVNEKSLPTLFDDFHRFLIDEPLSEEQRKAVESIYDFCRKGGENS